MPCNGEMLSPVITTSNIRLYRVTLRYQQFLFMVDDRKMNKKGGFLIWQDLNYQTVQKRKN